MPLLLSTSFKWRISKREENGKKNQIWNEEPGMSWHGCLGDAFLCFTSPSDGIYYIKLPVSEDQWFCNDITVRSWSETMQILSLRSFPLGPQLAAPSEQFEIVHSPPGETKNSLDPIKLRICWWPSVFALATVPWDYDRKSLGGLENGKRRVGKNFTSQHM